jgi:hypothetical protein
MNDRRSGLWVAWVKFFHARVILRLMSLLNDNFWRGAVVGGTGAFFGFFLYNET